MSYDSIVFKTEISEIRELDNQIEEVNTKLDI